MRAGNSVPTKPFAAYWVIALAIACGLALSQFLSQAAPPGSQHLALEWLSTPRPVAAFSLTSSDGQVTADSLRGHWQLLMLGYTQCPDLCPTTLAELAKLRTAVTADQLRIVFVSIDPRRDTPSRLAAYVQFFVDGDHSLYPRKASGLSQAEHMQQAAISFARLINGKLIPR